MRLLPVTSNTIQNILRNIVSFLLLWFIVIGLYFVFGWDMNPCQREHRITLTPVQNVSDEKGALKENRTDTVAEVLRDRLGTIQDQSTLANYDVRVSDEEKYVVKTYNTRNPETFAELIIDTHPLESEVRFLPSYWDDNPPPEIETTKVPNFWKEKAPVKVSSKILYGPDEVKSINIETEPSDGGVEVLLEPNPANEAEEKRDENYDVIHLADLALLMDGEILTDQLQELEDVSEGPLGGMSMYTDLEASFEVQDKKQVLLLQTLLESDPLPVELNIENVKLVQKCN